MDCLGAWRSIPPEGFEINVSQPQQAYVPRLYRSYYNVALMDLFGLLEVEHPATPPQPWCPAGLRHLPFGDAVFTLLQQKAFFGEFSSAPAEESDEEESEEVGHFGRWQPLFQPYFPEWQNNLVLPEVEGREGTFVFKVSLGKVWRRIAIPSDLSLEFLAGAILDSVDFDHDHLYEFIYRDRFGATVRVNHPFMDEGPFTSEVQVGELPLAPGQSMIFHFDFGDDWRFDVKLERIDPPNPRMKGARVLEKHGRPPKQYPSWE